MTLRPAQAFRLISLLSAACAIVFGLTSLAQADGMALPSKAVAHCNTITLACEDARSYGLCPIGVTDAGELVTATLTTPGPHYVRFVPMRNGYRYAGRGIWFDGKGPNGRLFFGQHRSVACAVAWH
jgi:hypothetical protein